MKASDTVASLFEMDRIGLTQWEQNLIQRHKAQQAEISFNAGIKEVVEWIEKTFSADMTKIQMMATNTWQAKLKEWGIEW